MLLLILVCIVKVGGVPVNITQNATEPTTGEMQLNGTNPETLGELMEDHVVQEGDILMPEDRNADSMAIWSDASIPYKISGSLAGREANVFAAFKMISDNTCIRFHKRTNELNYLKILKGRGCASFVGCQGGAQPVYYAQSCSVGNLCHELMHALGLYHEHTRRDRDQHITVQWESIRAGRKGYFNLKWGSTLNMPYDYDSIMHYGKYFFSAGLNPTIVPKKGGAQIGQRTHLSSLDAAKLRKLYRCGEREATWCERVQA